MSLIPRILQTLQSEAALLGPGLRGFCTKAPKTPEKKAPSKPKEAPKAAAPPPPPKKAAAPPPPPPKAAAPPPPPPPTPKPAAPVYTSAATPPAPQQPVGPGASKSGDYPNTEYYTYNKMSYFDLEVEMGADRIPQPAANNGHF